MKGLPCCRTAVVDVSAGFSVVQTCDVSKSVYTYIYIYRVFQKELYNFESL